MITCYECGYEYNSRFCPKCRPGCHDQSVVPPQDAGATDQGKIDKCKCPSCEVELNIHTFVTCKAAVLDVPPAGQILPGCCESMNGIVDELIEQQPRIDQLMDEYPDGTYQHRLAEELDSILFDIRRAKDASASNSNQSR